MILSGINREKCVHFIFSEVEILLNFIFTITFSISKEWMIKEIILHLFLLNLSSGNSFREPKTTVQFVNSSGILLGLNFNNQKSEVDQMSMWSYILTNAYSDLLTYLKHFLSSMCQTLRAILTYQ